MKNVVLKRLDLRNFKGIQSIEIPFTKETEIHGKNGIGKTTIADAYFWLLYGKNSLDQTDFEIKTLDKFNKSIPKLEHEVIGFFDVDGSEIKLSRVLKEKWKTKKGNDVEEMTGHETTYFVNDVPTSEGDYKKKVSEIIEESISKIVTNPAFFNAKMKWQDRRVMLSTMAGEVTDEMILNSDAIMKQNYLELIEILNSGKNLDDEKKVIGAKKKKIKDEIEQIPSRLDENNRQKPEPEDWDALEYSHKVLLEEIKSESDKIDNVNVSIQKQKDEILSIQKIKFEKEQELDRLSREETQKIINQQTEKKSKAEEIKRKSDDLIRLINSEGEEVKNQQQRITEFELANNQLREKIGKISESQFEMDPNQCKCPTCKQDLLNASEIESDLRSNFNKNKIEQIDAINTTGLANKKKIEEAKETIEILRQSIADNTSKYNAIQEELKSISQSYETSNVHIQIELTPEMIALKKEIESIEIPEIHSDDISSIRQKIEEINDRKKEIESRLLNKIQIDKIETRSIELKEQQRILSQELASLEKVEMQIDKFNKAKINFIEERINSKFKFVTFKMFKEQLNGGESPACECIVEGVPYSSLNTAMKINASLDIINAFQYHFGIFAPVFIDGRESITTLIPMECQVISLVVNSNEDSLKIVNV